MKTKARPLRDLSNADASAEADPLQQNLGSCRFLVVVMTKSSPQSGNSDPSAPNPTIDISMPGSIAQLDYALHVSPGLRSAKSGASSGVGFEV